MRPSVRSIEGGGSVNISLTRSVRVAYEQECRGLTALEMGVLWGLAAMGDCKWCCPAGTVRAEVEALEMEFGFQDTFQDAIHGVLERLQKKGKIRNLCFDGQGRVSMEVCFWYDRYAKEREQMRIRIQRRYKRMLKK